MKLKTIMNFSELSGIDYDAMELVLSSIGYEYSDDENNSDGTKTYYYENENSGGVITFIVKDNKCKNFEIDNQ